MITFPCPYLGSEVELSDERERHIRDHHPDLLPAYPDRIGTTLADPDQIRRSKRFGNARLFSKWYDHVCVWKTCGGCCCKRGPAPREELDSDRLYH